MKYCRHCGAEMYDDATTCPKCGRADQYDEDYVVPTKTNGFAIAGFILSFFGGLLGLIFSIVGLVQINRRGNQKGKGLAIAGIVISAVMMIVWELVANTMLQQLESMMHVLALIC